MLRRCYRFPLHYEYYNVNVRQAHKKMKVKKNYLLGKSISGNVGKGTADQTLATLVPHSPASFMSKLEKSGLGGFEKFLTNFFCKILVR